MCEFDANIKNYLKLHTKIFSKFNDKISLKSNSFIFLINFLGADTLKLFVMLYPVSHNSTKTFH